MLPLLTGLQHAAQRFGAGSSAAPGSASLASVRATAALWQQLAGGLHQHQQQHHQQMALLQTHPALPPLQQPYQQQQPFSSSAALRAAVQPLPAAPSAQEPCMLTGRVPNPTSSSSSGGGSGGSSSSVVHYPYPLPPLYSARPWQLQSLGGVALGAVELPGDVFNVPVRIDIMHQVVRWQRAKARQGTHKTKNRSEVSGGGRKPWQQKGSGRARQGSIRAPQWRGGGTVHGPVPRSYAFALPRKVRRLGLKCALSAKANEGRLIVLDSLKPLTPKTKAMAKSLQLLLDQQAAAAAAATAAVAAALARAQRRSSSQRGDRSHGQQQQQEDGGGRLVPPSAGADAHTAYADALGLTHVLLQQQAARAAAATTTAAPLGRRGRRGRARAVVGSSAWKAEQRRREAARSLAAGLPPVALPARRRALLLDSGKDAADGGAWLRRAAGNLPGVEVLPAAGANVLSLLRRDVVIMTKPALDLLVERLRRPINRLGAAGRAYQASLAARRRESERRGAAAAAAAGGGRRQQQRQRRE